MRIRTAGVGLVSLAFLITACGSDDGDDGSTNDGGGQAEPTAPATESVRVGALYPLTGSAAATGEAVLHGVELAAEVVNGEYPDIDLPLAAEAGLPGLDGATVEIVSADHEGNPERGASETERLITGEEVVAIVGAYFSAVTETASERAERLGVPFVNGSSSATSLTEDRDLQYFFRTGPSDLTFGETFFEFLADVAEQTGQPIDAIKILYENTDYGTGAAEITQQLASDQGYEVVDSIAHGNDVNDVTPEATRICSSNEDAPVFQASYTPEAILFTQAFKNLGCTPTILAYGAGYSDVSYFDAVGADGEYVISRAAWGLDAVADNPTAVAIAEMFEETYGIPMDENSARTFTAAHTLFVALNEAGSTEPDAIRDALAAIDMPAEDTIMPWDGIRFADSGQNELAQGIILQHLDGEYRVVWPFENATADLVWPPVPYGDR